MQNKCSLSDHIIKTIESISEVILGIEYGAFSVKEADIAGFINQYLSGDIKNRRGFYFPFSDIRRFSI